MSSYIFTKSPLESTATDKMPRRFTYQNEMPYEEETHEDDWSDYQEDSGYSSDDGRYGDYCEPERRWPQPIVARPHIPSLVKMYAPPLQKPEPLSEETLAEDAAYKAKASELNTAHSANCAAAKKISAELAALEEKSKTAFKWSSQRTGGDAQKKRLETDLAAAEKKKEASKAAIDEHKKASEPLRLYIAEHERLMKLWDDLEKEKRIIARMTREAHEAIERDMAEWRAARAAQVAGAK
jgi:hypothetical protein